MSSVSPSLRKLLLTAHVTSSVGWLGAVAVFLALAIAGATSDDVQLVRAAYLAMDWAAWVVLVPLALTSLLTGVLQSMATPWGLFRHYWVTIKLLLTLVATVVLLLYTQTLRFFGSAAGMPFTSEDLAVLRTPSVVLHSGAALLLLLATTVLAVYKPRGRTPYGQRIFSRPLARSPQ